MKNPVKTPLPKNRVSSPSLGLLGVSLVLMVVIAACSSTYRRSSVEAAERRANPSAFADKDMKEILDAQASLKPKPIETLSAVEARKQPSPADGVKKVMRAQGKNPNDPMGIVTREIKVDGGAGKIPARVYTPKDAKGLLPVVVYYHGGGWVIATNDTYDATPRAIAKQANAIVVSVEYRKAPEHKFPAAHDDAFAAYKWVLKNASSIGGDASRVAVLGESAGGNLAINTAIKARDRGIKIPVFQGLIYPVAGVETNTPSYQENANAKPLNKAMMGWFMKNTIRSDADKQDPRLDIITKANVSRLPPTVIITAEIDPLRTDGELLAYKLQQSGVDITYKTYHGVTHEFFGMGLLPEAVAAQGVVVSGLKDAFKKK